MDTNVFVRFVVHDDVDQTAKARRLILSLTPSSPGYLSLVTVAELYWVLNHTYKFSRGRLQRIIEYLLASEELVLQEALMIEEALGIFSEGNADFDDCLIECCSRAAGCTAVYTFDRKAAKSAGMQLLG